MARKISQIDPLFVSLMGFTLKKSDLTKITMIEATIKFLGANRADDLTFEKIGSIIGVRHSHVSHYFPNKEDLVEAALKYIAATWQAYGIRATEHIKNPLEKLRASIEADFDWIQKESSHKPLIGLLLYYSSLGGSYRSFFSKNRKLGYLDLKEILKECFPSARKETLSQLSFDIQHLVTGKALEFVCNPKAHSVTKLKNDALRLVNTMIVGMRDDLGIKSD